MIPSLYEAAGGEQNVLIAKPSTGSEDFSFYAKEVPGFFYFLGGMKPGTDVSNPPLHHTSHFQVEDSSMQLGIKSLCYLALDYMAGGQK